MEEDYSRFFGPSLLPFRHAIGSFRLPKSTAHSFLSLDENMLTSHVPRAVPITQLLLLFAILAGSLPVVAQPAPVLTWISDSSPMLEQIIGDVDWEAKAQHRPEGHRLVCAYSGVGRCFA